MATVDQDEVEWVRWERRKDVLRGSDDERNVRERHVMLVAKVPNTIMLDRRRRNDGVPCFGEREDHGTVPAASLQRLVSRTKLAKKQFERRRVKLPIDGSSHVEAWLRATQNLKDAASNRLINLWLRVHVGNAQFRVGASRLKER